MKKLLVTLSAAFALFSFVVLEGGSWSLDGAHSRLGFTVKHMGISETNGQFDKFTVKITTPNADFTGATIELSAEAKSINTYLEMRDNHLRSADFFDTEKFPTLTFKSASIKKVKGNKYTIVGDLTLHGVTKSITLVGVHVGSSKNREGAAVAGLKVTGVFKRSDFGIGASMPASALADEIYLNADLEVVKN